MADQPAKKQKTDVETMGISEMKALIKSAGLSSADCVEGLDFVGQNKEPTDELAKLQRGCRGRVRALVASVSTMFMGTPPCMREDGPMDLAEYICEAGDGMTVNLLDRPAEQIGSLLDGAPDHAATVNTIRRGLREFGFSA